MSDKSSSKKNKSIADRVLSALKDVLYSALSQGYEPEGKFVKRYGKYVQEINSAYNKNGKAKAIAKWIVPDEDAYNKKTTEYPNYYKDELLTNLLKLLELFREIALASPSSSQPKEKCIRSKDEIDDIIAQVFGKKK